MPQAQTIGLNMRTRISGYEAISRSAMVGIQPAPLSGNSGKLDLSDSSVQRIASAFADKLADSGLGDSAVYLNDREIGRYMRRGLAGGFA